MVSEEVIGAWNNVHIDSYTFLDGEAFNKLVYSIRWHHRIFFTMNDQARSGTGG